MGKTPFRVGEAAQFECNPVFMHVLHNFWQHLGNLMASSATGLRRSWGLTAVLLLVWCLAVFLGWHTLASYSQKVGELATPPAFWPTGSILAQGASGKCQLLLFVHPHCPCTRATISELARLLARHADDTECVVVAVKPNGTPSNWTASDLMESAAAIPGVQTLVDFEGREAERFGARTSGIAMYYDRSGKLAFYGGLTSARGHEGDSLGLAAVSDCLSGQAPRVAHTDVYGCPLFTPFSSVQDSPDSLADESCPTNQSCCQLK